MQYEKLQIKYSKYTDYEKRNRIINNLMSKGYTYKQISKLINNTTSFFFIIFIPFVLLVFFEIIDIIEDKKREANE